MKKFLSTLAIAGLLSTTGCFRVGSETRALRDAALENGVSGANEKIELGVGMLTLSIAKFASSYVELPPEARTLLASLKGAEVSVYTIQKGTGDYAKILAEADKAMAARHCTRLVGVLHEQQLVAIYVPKNLHSARNVRTSVLVLNRDQLVCTTAHADIRDVLDLALAKMEEALPPPSKLASTD